MPTARPRRATWPSTSIRPTATRSALVSPDGKTIYVATDVRGNALGNDGKPVNDMKNPGSIIAFIYDAKQ